MEVFNRHAWFRKRSRQSGCKET